MVWTLRLLKVASPCISTGRYLYKLFEDAYTSLAIHIASRRPKLLTFATRLQEEGSKKDLSNLLEFTIFNDYELRRSSIRGSVLAHANK